MPRNILIVYSTTDGHTREISERIAGFLDGHGHSVELADVGSRTEWQLDPYDTIIVGASIRYGHHSPRLMDFIRNHAPILAGKKNAFFSVNAVARKPHKRQATTNPYVRKFLRRVPWQPQSVEVFAGKIDYPRYGMIDRAIIRLIMLLTGGPTDPTSVTDFTDWDQVAGFANRLAEE